MRLEAMALEQLMKKNAGKRKLEVEKLADLIEVKFHENRRCYGVKRMREELQGLYSWA